MAGLAGLASGVIVKLVPWSAAHTERPAAARTNRSVSRPTTRQSPSTLMPPVGSRRCCPRPRYASSAVGKKDGDERRQHRLRTLREKPDQKLQEEKRRARARSLLADAWLRRSCGQASRFWPANPKAATCTVDGLLAEQAAAEAVYSEIGILLVSLNGVSVFGRLHALAKLRLRPRPISGPIWGLACGTG